jgi:UDPglucose 6-dehydrogenase
LVLIESVLEAGALLRVHDPEAIDNVRAVYGDRLTYCDRPYGALEQADALVVTTDWNEFRNPDFEVMYRLLRQPVVLDGRNLYDPVKMATLGFMYYGIGRLPVLPSQLRE